MSVIIVAPTFSVTQGAMIKNLFPFILVCVVAASLVFGSHCTRARVGTCHTPVATRHQRCIWQQHESTWSPW